jgi:hypothetical protein
MSWTCPDCGKEFRHTNQWHSCETRSVEDHLRGRTPDVRRIVQKLLDAVRGFGDVTLNPVKTSIQLKAGATFLSIRAKKDHVEIEFQSTSEKSAFPVYKSVRISKNRVWHAAVIEEEADVDAGLLGRIRESYNLMK